MMQELFCFRDDRRGVVGAMTAVGAIAIVGGTTFAVDFGLASIAKSEVMAAIQEACGRIEAQSLRAETDPVKRDAAQAVLDRRLGAIAGADGVVAQAVTSGGSIQLQISGSIDAKVAGSMGDFDLAFTVDCETGSATAASAAAAGIVFAESFENPPNRTGWSWQVRPDLLPWTTLAGPGVEIHRPTFRGFDRNRFGGTFPVPPDGQQFAELDSATGRGALPSSSTNTAIATEIWLEAGQYELSTMYTVKLDPAAGNGIEVYLENATRPVMSQQLGIMDGDRSWREYVFRYDASVSGHYRLAYSAIGAANDNGGAIDQIVLRRLPF